MFGSCVFSIVSWVMCLHRNLNPGSRVLLSMVPVWLELPTMVGRRKSTWPGRFCYKTCTKGNWKYLDSIFLALRIKTKCISSTRGYVLTKTCVSITSNTAYKMKFSIKTALVNFVKFPENANLLTFTKEVLIEKLSTFGVY